MLEAGVTVDAHCSGCVVEETTGRKLDMGLNEGPSLPFKYREGSSLREWKVPSASVLLGTVTFCQCSAFC